jgi:hypothetical protein
MIARPYCLEAFAAFMELDNYNSTTSSFYTIDACNGELAEKIMQVLCDSGDKEKQSWKKIVEQNPELDSRLRSQSIAEPMNRDSITWDRAVILFTCTVELNKQQRPLKLGEQLSKERFGRFPWGNGSAIDYLLEFIKPNNKSAIINSPPRYDEMISLLNKLNSFCYESKYGGDVYSNGLGGLNLCGVLNKSEVHLLRKDLTGRRWSVSADEPLDGGVRDAIKHLVLILKAAERFGVGIMLRTHN